jgi:TonB-linked SusC/RagA family outer membrane protein
MKIKLNYFKSGKKSLKYVGRAFCLIGLMMMQFFLVSTTIAGTNEKLLLRQTLKITGTISDAATGESLPGVSVAIEGTSTGTMTDADGKYSIEVMSANVNLVFSFVGYLTEKVGVEGKTQIDVRLVTDFRKLNEVVVVGYGTQNKKTLTGSVFQVKGDDVLKGKATTNVAEGLQGTIPGLTITRTSSRPGNENTSINLRGGISVNETHPMIVVDGAVAYDWELSQINPNDIESVSVLKDASAAIYGTRAGSGVILITTKRGNSKEGKVKVNYSGSTHENIIGKKFPVADGQLWGKMFVAAVESDASAVDLNGNTFAPNWWIFPEAAYRALANGQKWSGIANGIWRIFDPGANANQFDLIYGNTWGQAHNLSFRGGTDKLGIMSSLGYADDRSLLSIAYDGQKKYNFRTNLDYKVNDWIKTEFNVAFDDRIVSTPAQGIGNGVQDMYIFPLYNPYGQFYDTFGNNNLLAKLTEGGRTKDDNQLYHLGGKVTLNLDKITKGLSIDASANARIFRHLKIERTTHIVLYDWSGETKYGLPDTTLALGSGVVHYQSSDASCYVKNTNENDLYQTYNGFVNYKRGFAGHNIGIMVGLTAEKEHYQNFYQYRGGMVNDALDDINVGDPTTAQATGGSNENALLSYLGRVNYDYKGIYLLEGTFRRDGSSKFDQENRWANFAGASGGLRISEYAFMKELSFVNNLKLRGSYGETGSQTGIGNYDYISGISSGTTVFGYTGTLTPTSNISYMVSNLRTWERVATTNIGIDFSVLGSRLDGSFEVYNRKNKGMLISMIYPQTLGATAPKTNDGNFVSNGWELVLNWNDKIGKDFSYHVGITLDNSKTKITEYKGAVTIVTGLNNPVTSTSDVLANKAVSFIESKPLNAIYVYKTKGYLQNWDDVKAYYTEITKTAGGLQSTLGTSDELTPGCVKKIDANGDGKITTADLQYYGDANPHYLFGINLGATYKNIDFSMFIQGVGQQYVVRTGSFSGPWSVSYQEQNATYWGKTWTPDNTNAPYPIASRNGARTNWNYNWTNDINVHNCWYARAKNIVLGYTLPETLLRKVKIDKLRIYASADNLFEISNVTDGFDPETKPNTAQGNLDVYARTLSFGIDLTF